MNLAPALVAAGDVASAHRMLASTMDDPEPALGAKHSHPVALLDAAVSPGLLQEDTHGP
jgi:hypothetical protein